MPAVGLATIGSLAALRDRSSVEVIRRLLAARSPRDPNGTAAHRDLRNDLPVRLRRVLLVRARCDLELCE